MATTGKGVPYPAPTDSNNVPVDLQKLADWITAAPGVSALTTAARDALTGSALWDGRVIWNTTTLTLERYDATATPSPVWRAAALSEAAANAAYVAKTLVDVKGDLLVGSAADTLARLAPGTNGQVLKANAAAALGVEWGEATATSPNVMLRKTADEAIVSSIALQNDDHLSLALAANEAWAFDVSLFVTGATGGDIKVAFVVPAGASLIWVGHGYGVSATAYEASGSFFGRAASGDAHNFGTLTGDTIPSGVVLRGFVINGSTAGALNLQWAQATSQTVATTVRAGSHLIARKAA